MKRTFVLTSLLAFAAFSPNDSGYGASPSPDAAGLCVPVRGSFCGEKVPESPDPLVAYRWERPLASDDLEHYELHPLSIEMRTASGKTRSIRPGRPIRIDEPCTLMFDFGQVNAGWLAFDSDDLAGEVEMSISEYTEPAVLNAIAANNHFPSIILPESVAERAAGLGDYHSNPYTYSFAGASFTAEDHAKASDELEALARDLGDVVVNVSDIENAARQNRLIAQAFQLFVLCFSVITTLIAVANVFNTLANGIILRTREFAALRSIGMGNRAFARMLAYECASYALRGLGIGLAAAVAVTFALFAATSMAFAGLEFTLPWDYVALAVAIVAVVLALSVAYALRRSHASNIVEALRSDAI